MGAGARFTHPVVGLGVAAGLALAAVAVTVQGAGGQLPPIPDADRELATNVSDGFTVAAVGDLIFARPISQLEDPAFTGVVRLLQSTDVTFGNFEGSAIDIRRFEGHPQAEFGGVWIIGVPEVAADLKKMGFDLVSRANNHATDWGVEGMRETSEALDAAGIVHAGVGETRAAARAGRYQGTPKGRVGVVSMASSFTPMSQAMDPLGEAPGRPGLSALRTTRYVLVTPDELERLRTIRDEQPAGSVRVNPNQPDDEVTLFGVSYRASDVRGVEFEMNEVDKAEILNGIRHAKHMSDFVVATIHAHNPGNWSDQPAAFLPELARATIDAGADQFVGHGPHQLRGIEIYKGKPIFYSLGNFIFQLDLLDPVGQDLYERFSIDPVTTTNAEFSRRWTERVFDGTQWYQSVVAVSRFDQGRVSEVRLHPVDSGFKARGANRGIPRLASADVAQEILERLQRLSAPFGTTIEIEQNVGIIRVGAAPSEAAAR